MTTVHHEAMYYEKLGDGRVHCRLCPHECRIRPDGVGICRQRRNDAGTLVSLIYGRMTSAAMDPIEKKPLYQFHPWKQILSLGTNGCNFACSFCHRPRSLVRGLVSGPRVFVCESCITDFAVALEPHYWWAWERPGRTG